MLTYDTIENARRNFALASRKRKDVDQKWRNPYALYIQSDMYPIEIELQSELIPKTYCL